MTSLRQQAIEKAVSQEFISSSKKDIDATEAGGEPWDAGVLLGASVGVRVFTRRELTACEIAHQHIVDSVAYYLWASLIFTHGKDLLAFDENRDYFNFYLEEQLNRVEPTTKNFDSATLVLLRRWHEKTLLIVDDGKRGPPHSYMEAAETLHQLAANYLAFGELLASQKPKST